MNCIELPVRLALKSVESIFMVKWLSIVFWSLCLCTKAFAGAISADDIPDALTPWVPWVLYGEATHQCPLQYLEPSKTQCYWAGKTALNLDNQGGRFSQDWQVIYPQWLALPGDLKQWPQDVLIDGKAAVVVNRNNRPHVYLLAGQHHVSGQYQWLSLPRSFLLPVDVGLVSLTINDEAQHFPTIDADGRLWLKDRQPIEQKQPQDSISVHVQRHIIDDIPMQIDTRIELNVAGSERELLLQGALPDGFIAMTLQSPLPAKLELDGQLRVQLKPGQWVLTVRARSTESIAQLALPTSVAPWPNEEIWVFEAKSDLRQVALSGLTAIDPKNSRLPSHWQQWPAYRIQANDALQLVEKQRGDVAEQVDKLSLVRHWWLDFDGQGFSLQDQISGDVRGRYRLPMIADIALGRVSVNGQDQFITQLNSEQKQGVELRDGYLDLVADSRWLGGLSLPATGWDARFASVSATLNLPPGWRLLAATGVDTASGTWLSNWSLLDLFLVFIIAASFSHLWGKQWGLLTLLAMVLIYHEQGAPTVVWLNVLAASALLTVLPSGRFKTWTQRYFFLSVLGVVIISLPFMVQQARQGLYPQLEYQNYQVTGEQPQLVTSKRIERREKVQSKLTSERMMAPTMSLEMDSMDARAGQVSNDSGSNKLLQYEQATKIQTGPGLPNWQWRSSHLSFNGPVIQGQKIDLWLMSPTENQLLAFGRIILLVLMLLCVAGWRGRLKWGGLAPAIVLVLSVGTSSFPSPVMAEALPDSALLAELKSRLLAAPDCAPVCADSPKMTLSIQDETLMVRQRIDAAVSVVVPLVGLRGHWTPSQVLLDGEETVALHHDKQGLLWLKVPAGQHEVLMRGLLPQQATVQLMLPLKPHIMTATSNQYWQVEGNTQAGQISDLVLKRRVMPEGASTTKPELMAGVLPAFLKVERRLLLGQQWQLETIVTRMTPADSLVQLEIPLLAGEIVTQSGMTVDDGNVAIRLPQGQAQFRWQSLITESKSLTLQAQSNTAWVEHWSLVWAPIWHVEWQGLPQIVSAEAGSANWRPWPGESLNLSVQRPIGGDGQTLTLDRSRLEVKPGIRSSDVSLQLVLRSSLGQEHLMSLPTGAELMSVKRNGQVLALAESDGKLQLPIHPGEQVFDIVWRQATELHWWYSIPIVDMGIEGVNHDIHVTMPRDRWLLAVGGPDLGPAVLMWGVLLVLILLATALGKLPLTPLKSWHWALLLVGLTQASMWTLMIVVAWLLLLGWRADRPLVAHRFGFNLVQIGLGILTLVALSSLFFAIEQGLLGQPEMQIVGNGSFAYNLHWYQDRTLALWPVAWVVSVPLFVYRALMLLWALWLAFALISWLRWGWSCYSKDGLWRRMNLTLPTANWGRFSKTKEEKDES